MSEVVGKIFGRRRASIWVALFPISVLLVVFFVLPLANLFGTSLAPRAGQSAGRLGAGNYALIFTDGYYIVLIANSLAVGIATTLLTLALSYPLAFYITKTKGWERTIISSICMLPLFINVIVGILGWYILLLPYGVIQQALSALGLMEGPLHALRSYPALVAVLAYEHIPFAVLLLVSSLQAIPQDKISAARILGADVGRIFITLILPLSMPALVASAILVFALSSSSYLTPILIGAQRLQVLPPVIFSYGTEQMNWPLAAALAFVLLFIVVALTYLFSLAMDKLSRRGQWDMV